MKSILSRYKKHRQHEYEEIDLNNGKSWEMAENLHKYCVYVVSWLIYELSFIPLYAFSLHGQSLFWAMPPQTSSCGNCIELSDQYVQLSKV